MDTVAVTCRTGSGSSAASQVRLPEHVLLEGTSGRILREALLLFAERGFYGTSIRNHRR